MKNNKWLAPVKKQQIFESLLDKESEGQEIDLAVVANQIERYGMEADMSMRALINKSKGVLGKTNSSADGKKGMSVRKRRE